MNSPLRKPKYRFIDSAAANDIAAEPVPLEGVFQLTRPRFEPLTGNDIPSLDDGEKPTAVGLALMELWGAANDKDWRDCPTGVVRAIEAVSATNENADRIRQMLKGPSARWERNHAGIFCPATIDVLVPAVGAATVQPRGNTKYGQLLRDRYREPLIHEIGDGLVIRGLSAAHFDHIRVTQLDAINPGFYNGERRDFVESLALEGIRESLRGFVYGLESMEGGAGNFVETDDGYTRIAIAQYLISVLTGGLPADLSRIPWENGDGTQQLRGWTARKIQELHEIIEFDEAPFDVWPERETTAGIDQWLRNATAEAQVVMRLMTARMSIGIKVKPHARHSTHDVVYADMARFHVRGHQPAPWSSNDDEAFKARTIISNLTREGFIDDDEHDVFLGLHEIPWDDSLNRDPYRNRLVATVDTMVRVVVEDPGERERYPAVRRILKGLQVPNSPAQAASAAASLAAQVGGLEGSGEIGAFNAMVRRSFSNPQLRRLAEQEGDWTACIFEDVAVLAERAREELTPRLGTSSHANFLGPNMRALAILAMVGHGMNPKLTEYRKQSGTGLTGSQQTVRWPSSMTINGRGGRGGGSAGDAHTIVFHMARSLEGIDELEAIVRAVVDQADPTLPLDPITGEPLLEDGLRQKWARNPDRAGKPYKEGPETQVPTPEPDGRDQDPRDGDKEDGPSRTAQRDLGLSEEGAWNLAISAFRDELRGMAAKAATLSRVPVGPERAEVDADDWDPDDDNYARMLEEVGVDDGTADGFNDDADSLRKFFADGLIAWFRNRTR